MKTTQDIAKKYTDKAREKQKKQYDKRATASRISVGDKVLVKILAFEGKLKIADKFEEDIYEVIEQPRQEIPVFKIRSKNGVERILHRNHLLHIQTTDTDEEDEEAEEKIFKPVPKKRKTKLPVKRYKNEEKGELQVIPKGDDKGDVTSDTESSDSGEEYVPYTYKGGDAHLPETEKEIHRIRDNTYREDSKDEETVVHTKGTDEETVDVTEGTDGAGIITEEDLGEEELGNLLDNLEVQTEEQAETETSAKEIDKDIATKEANETSVKKIGDDATEMKKDDEKKKSEGAIRKETDTKTQDTASKETNKTGADSGGVQKNKKGPKPAPRPPTRISERSKKKPVRYEDYEMNLIVQRLPDCRLHALDVFINSGVLSNVDPEVAKKVINAVIQ